LRRLATAIIIFSLTGCASLPMSGPVRIGPDLTPSTDVESFYYSPSGPVDGASRSEILSGFLAAGTGPQNDYAVAREFLSESFRSIWNPSLEVLVQRSTQELVLGPEDKAQLTVDYSARVDADGKYEAQPQGTSKTLEFSFVREDGQWRIASAPDVTVLIRPVFEVVFRDYSVYFVDRQKRYLVPELRWFPTTAATGTKLVNALLRGPSSWLRPALISAIPTGTRLSIDAVTVESGNALVDLTARALVATRADRTLLKAQLDATLSQLPNVDRVSISIERSRQEIPDSTAQFRASPANSLIVLGGSGLESIGTSDTAFFNPSSEFLDLNPVSLIALSRQSRSLAAATPAGVIRTSSVDAGAAVELVDSRSGIVAMEYDRQDYLWSLGRARGSDILVTLANGPQVRVSAPWLQAEAVRGFSISPEGSRVVILVTGQARNRVLVSAVVRNQSGAPVELSPPIEIATEATGATGVSWVDPTTVAVINATGDFTNAHLVSIGGATRIISAVPDAIAIAASAPSSLLYLLSASGELFRFTGSTWSLLRDDVVTMVVVN